jgi:parallel beta-helix repeat protein
LHGTLFHKCYINDESNRDWERGILREKAVSYMILVLLSISIVAYVVKVKPAEAWTGTVFIRADGGIDPPSAPIQRNGDLYTIFGNLTTTYGPCIIIERNSMTLDGQGYTINGPGDYGVGIEVLGKENVEIHNTQIKTLRVGISLGGTSKNNRIYANNITANWWGIFLDYSSSKNSISGNNIGSNDFGIWSAASSFNSIYGNNITANSSHGVFLSDGSSDNNISANSMTSNLDCIVLNNSPYNNITENNMTANHQNGIILGYSSFNNIQGNNIVANQAEGIISQHSSFNSISENNIAHNGGWGIWFYDCSNHSVYHNNFTENPTQAVSDGSGHVWDDGYPSGGNYWSDYTGIDKYSGQNQDEPSNDGIGDTPYVIDGNNRDQYPLMVPYCTLYAQYDWPMFHHDLTHSGYTDSKAPSTNTTIWSYTTGDFVTSSVAVTDGKIFAGSYDQKVYCLNASTGEHIWNYTMGSNHLSSPCVSDGILYMTSSFEYKLYALDAATGELIWYYQLGGQTVSSPAVAAGRVYVGSCENGKIHCLNASTGEHIWNYTTSDWVISSPAVVNNRVYIGSDDHKIYCLNAITGELIWDYITSARVANSPAVVDDRVYIGSAPVEGIGYLYCLNATDGTLLWSYATAEGGIEFSSPAVAYGRVYVGSLDHNVYCLNATSGALIWDYTTGDFVNSSPAIADGKVYIGSADSKVFCLDATDGKLIWSYATGNIVYASPAVAYGNVYVGSWDGKVYAFGEIHDVAITEVTTSKTGCLPKPTVGQGKIATINTTVENHGEYTETFSVTIYADSTQIGLRQATLSQGENTTLSFAWDTTGFTYGNHSLRAEIGIIPFETDTGNNAMESWIIITIPGDIDGNYNVQLADLVLLAKAYGSKPGDPNWTPNSDIDNNDVVGLSDLVILATYYGQHYP